MKAVLKSSLVLVSLITVAACGSEAGTAYKGRPLLEISGSVRIENDQSPPDLVPALAFPTASGLLVRDVDVHGEFPARFTLNVFEPPPPEALRADPGMPMAAVAYLTAVPSDHEGVIPIAENVTLDHVACDDVPAEVASEWCTEDYTTCFKERKLCTCPLPVANQTNGEETCEVLEATGNPVIKDPWATFGGVSKNVAILWVPQESLSAVNEMAFSTAVTGGQGFAAGYNLILARQATVEEREVEYECETTLQEQAFAEYNTAHGTSYSNVALPEGDNYEEVMRWVYGRRAELERDVYCGNEWVLQAVDPDTTSIEVQLGTSLEPFSYH